MGMGDYHSPSNYEFAAKIFGSWDGTSHSSSDLFSTLGFIAALSCSCLTIWNNLSGGR